MKKLLTFFVGILLTLGVAGCGQEGKAIAPGSGSTIEQVKADCNGESCI